MTGVAPVPILVADDDPDDRLLIEDAFTTAGLGNPLRFVENGDQLLDYLRGRGAYIDRTASPRPGLVLLDLNMPGTDGRAALAAMKADPDLRRIPVVVLTTSRAEDDVVRCYDLGVSGFVRKPVSFEALLEVVGTLGRYWNDIVELPPG